MDQGRARPSKLRLPFLSLVVKRGRGTAARVGERARSETSQERGQGKRGKRRRRGGRLAGYRRHGENTKYFTLFYASYVSMRAP